MNVSANFSCIDQLASRFDLFRRSSGSRHAERDRRSSGSGPRFRWAGAVRPAVVIAMFWFNPVHADLAVGMSAYERGEFRAALREFEPLARDGDPLAQYNLAQMYRLGQGVAQDWKAAARYYQAAANQGLVRAQFNLGVMYEKGLGVDKSLIQAADWFQRAAEQGSSSAARALESLRDTRNELGAQLRRDRVSLLLEANRGDPGAQYELGLAYALAVGGERDFELAARWLRNAAVGGITGAQVQLAVMYANAQGVERDLVEAYAWLLVAAGKDDSRARWNLTALANRLSPLEREAARKRSRELEAVRADSRRDSPPAVSQ